MTESLIGAVGLKEFVFGTSFLSVSFKDQDSSQAAPSSSRSVSLRPSLLSLLPLSPFTAHSPFSGALSISACAFFTSREPLTIFSCAAHQPAGNRQPLSESRGGPGGQRQQRARLDWQSVCPCCVSSVTKSWKLSGPLSPPP